MKFSAFASCLAAVTAAWLTWSAPARACVNDTDCPGTTCGSQVCTWGAAMTCTAAGQAAQGSDGWCTTNANCKCPGATCNPMSFHCSFTMPQDAGGGTSGTSTSGTSTSGTSTSGTSTSGTSTSGTSGPGTSGSTAPATTSGGNGCALA